jgi:LuxR family maltose regulon positive regulatory protein
MATILGWLEVLPDDLVRERPRLGLLHAWALLGVMQFEAIEQRLREVEQSVRLARIPVLTETEKQGILGEIAAIRATAVGMQGNIAATIELCREALDRLPEEEQRLRGTIANSLGVAYSARGETVAASRALTEAAMLSQAAGNTLIALIALGNLAGQQEVQGQLHRAAETCHRALQLASELGGPLSPAAGMAHVELGRLLCEWGQLDDATRHLTDAIELGKQAGIMELVVSGLISLAAVHKARGDLLAASETLEETVLLGQKHSISAGLAAVLAACQARLWIRQGQFDAAVHWAQQSGLDTDDPSSHLHHDEYIVLARLLMALGKAGKALDLLARLLQAAEHQGRMGHAVKVLVLQALAFQGQGEHDQAMDALAQALVIGEPEDYLQTFVIEGVPMAELVQQAASRGIAVGYASRLLTAIEATTKAQGPSTETRRLSATHHPPSVLIDPLSERELEVLRLVASGLSNREIAKELVITVGTAKWHLHNIYGKLGVHSRTQAVARARELALL